MDRDHEAAVDARGGIRLRGQVPARHQRLLDAEADPEAVSAADECRQLGQGPALRREICRHGLHRLDPHDLDEAKAHIDSYRRLAREEYGRELQIWGNGYVVQGETQKEAEDYLHHYVVEKGDDAAVENILRIQGEQMQRLLPELLEGSSSASRPAGAACRWSARPSTSPTSWCNFARIGLDGILLSWVDYPDGLARWQREVMPRLEQAGLRRPVAHSQPT